MLKKIISLALAAAALAATGASQDLFERAANANDVVVAAAKPQGSGIKAEVQFVRSLDGKGLQVDVRATGLTSGEKYPYHIHASPVPSNGNCTATGAHLDPYGIKAAAGSNYKCQPSSPDTTCELGDLAGIYGNMVGDSKGNFNASYNAALLTFGGKNTILDHSVVIHATNGTRLACANIIGYVLATGTDKAVPDHESGSATHSDDLESKSSGASHVAALSTLLLLLASATLA
ncbi:Superoxide dismutase [Coemansia biformis]|uniref:Superoxide dismutase n=1 Tax=Coemansia biformis TaxID=1286918 RepID=A0A9W7YG96_9FUNG|nr:Superoxide dismutase [Coemansia biformis]